ncbi:MAG: PKD domain-containing protein [Balneola sp.]|nr:MAG: PKD domain-containing protein [Balneola sp.]
MRMRTKHPIPTIHTIMKNSVKITMLLCAVTLFIGTSNTWAQGPVQPEAMQFEPVDVTDVVNLATGDFVYTIPLMEVPGPEGGYPIVLSYHSGIGPNQPATWVGLGWTLNPGAINRTISGYPDDYDGDIVKTTYKSDKRSGWGVSIGAGFGSYGLNMEYDTHRGFGGTVSLGIKSGGPGSETGLGVEFGYHQKEKFSLNGYASVAGKSRISIGTEGASFSANNLPFSPRISSNGDNVNLSLQAGSIGMSLNSNQKGANFGIAGSGFSTSTTAGGGTYNSFSFFLPIPTPYGFTLNLGYSEWEWYLDELDVEPSYGFLNKTEGQKNERIASGKYLFPANDVFSVASQGFSGMFQSFDHRAFIMEDHDEREKKGELHFSKTINSIPYDFNGVDQVGYRFLNDQGFNFINKSADASWGENLNSFDNERVQSSIIISEESSSGRLEGFSVIKSDGSTYVYEESINNYFQYSEVEVNDDGSILKNTNSLNSTFGTSWLLTSVEGSDYVDRPPSGYGPEDWGYWVKFNYTQDDNAEVWRAPFQGTAPTEDPSAKTFSAGIRDVKYLSSVETKTHIASFTPAQKKKTSPTQSLNFVNYPQGVIGSEAGVYDFRGDFSWVEDYLNPGDPFVTVRRYAVGCSAGQVCEPDYDNPTNETTISYNTGIVDYDPAKDVTEIDGGTGLTTSYSCLSVPNSNPPQVLCVFSIAYLEMDQIMNAQKNYQKSLSSISLKEKISNEVIQSISFEYDYSLRPNTNGSTANVSDGADEGSLTLKAIYFKGRNSTLAFPPYRFQYANNDAPFSGMNPGYHIEDIDRWGVYRDPDYDNTLTPQDRANYIRETPQNKNRADKSAAWSLTSITTPNGANIGIEYESDDYFYLNNEQEVSASELVDLNKADASGNFLFISTPSSPLLNMELGDKLILIEKRVTVYSEVGDPSNNTIISQGIIDDVFTYIDIIPALPSYEFDKDISTYVKEDSYTNGDGTAFDKYDQIYTYKLGILKNQVYGGGSRVKSITSKDGTNFQKTLYLYKNGNISSGVIASLPRTALHQKHGLFETDISATSLNYGIVSTGTAFDKKYDSYHMNGEYSYGRPSPGVLYSNVVVMNVDEFDNPINGYTEFEFYTAKDHQYTVEITNEFDSDDRILSIKDYSGIYGKPKATTFYEQINDAPSDAIFRPIGRTEYHYQFSDKLTESANVLGENFVADNDLSKPLGSTQQKYISYHETTNGNWETTRIERINYNVFEFAQTVEEFEYENDTDIVESNKLVKKTRIIGFDKHTGQALVNVTQSEEAGELLIDQTTPAWWKYSGMKTENMLSQSFESKTFRTDEASLSYSIADINDVEILKQYPFPNEDVIASSVNTWSQWGDENVWRKNDSYQYVTGFAYLPFPATDLGYSQSDYVFATSSKPWEMTSNINQYDNFGNVIESSNKDGTFNSVIYDDGNNSLVKAVATNAKFSEVIYLDFEDESNSAGRTGESAKFFNGSLNIAQAPPTPSFGGNYKAYLWLYTTAVTTINGKTIPAESPARWRLIKESLNPGGAINVNGNGYIDDITIIPEYASISYFSYDPVTWKVKTMTSPNHRTTFYEYDDVGRLKLTRDFENNILSKNEYGYSGEFYIAVSPDNPTVSSPVTFTVKNTIDDSDASLSEYIWSFGDGDGAQSTGSNSVTHTYNDAQNFTVSLALKNSDDISRKLIHEVSIGVPINITFDEPSIMDCKTPDDIVLPVPKLADPPAPNVVCDVSLEAFTSNTLGAITYEWSRYDETNDEWNVISGANSSLLELSEEPIGSVTVRLKVTDTTNSTSERTTTIFVGEL